MHLVYHSNEIKIFNNLKIKRILPLLQKGNDDLFLLNLYLSHYLKKIIFYYENIGINLMPYNLVYPFNFAKLNEEMKYDQLKYNIDKYIKICVFLFTENEIFFPFIDLKVKTEMGMCLVHRCDLNYSFYAKGDSKIFLECYLRIRENFE